MPTIATAKPKPKTTPAHTSSGGGGGVTPHNLGLPNFVGYCHHIGDRTAELIASNAYGWRCTLNTAHVLQITDVCAWTYRLSASQVVSVSANYADDAVSRFAVFADPYSWQCWD